MAVPVLVPVAEPVPLPEGSVVEPVAPVLVPVGEPVPLPEGLVAEPVPVCEGPVEIPVIVLLEKSVEAPGTCVYVVVVVVGITVVTVIV